MAEFTGKVIVLTGASQGIGRWLSHWLHKLPSWSWPPATRRRCEASSLRAGLLERRRSCSGPTSRTRSNAGI